MAALVMVLNWMILWFTLRSSLNKPLSSIRIPNKKYLNDLSWETVSEISLLSQTEIVWSSIFSLKEIPKKVLTIVSPAIEADKSFASKLYLFDSRIFWIYLSTISLILGMNLLKKLKWKIPLIIFLLFDHSWPSEKVTPCPKNLTLF
jgi:uncharacterized membrane protein